MAVGLLPSFMLREAGLIVNDTPKIQVNSPTVEDHSILFKETGFCIPLSLWGIFSFFPTKIPKQSAMAGSENVYLLTPTRWNPHSDSYARNEEAMLDWQGNLTQERHRPRRIMLEDIEDNAVMAASLSVGKSITAATDALLVDIFPSIDDDTVPMYEPCTVGCRSDILCPSRYLSDLQ